MNRDAPSQWPDRACIQNEQALAGLREPYDFWLTPFWFRVFVAVLAAVAAVLVAFVVTTIVSTWIFAGALGGFELVLGGALALVLAATALRFLNPLDRRRWFRFAVSRDGLHMPARGSRLIFVPWSSLTAVDVERWHSKGGEHSAARLTLDLDEDLWPWFGREFGVNGAGRVRRIRLNVVDVTGDEIAARLASYRDQDPDAAT